MGKEGAHVVVTSRDEGRGKEALKRLQEAEPSAKFEYCQADITDSKSIQDCAKWLKEKHGHVTWLMNNAGKLLGDTPAHVNSAVIHAAGLQPSAEQPGSGICGHRCSVWCTITHAP